MTSHSVCTFLTDSDLPTPAFPKPVLNGLGQVYVASKPLGVRSNLGILLSFSGVLSPGRHHMTYMVRTYYPPVNGTTACPCYQHGCICRVQSHTIGAYLQYKRQCYVCIMYVYVCIMYVYVCMYTWSMYMLSLACMSETAISMWVTYTSDETSKTLLSKKAIRKGKWSRPRYWLS